MKYINQLNFDHIPYPTDLETPSSIGHTGSVKLAGCGICCLCMAVDQLTMEELSVEECVRLSLESGANHAAGTDMKILGPVVAERFSLDYRATDDIQEAVRHLQKGGRVIANVGGDRDGGAYKGIFSHGGHFLLLVSTDGAELCVLDPSWRPDKFQGDGRVHVKDKWVYCAKDVMDKEAENRSPRYYLFSHR